MTNLEFAKYRFVIRPRESLILPAYKGSTFRGGFGYAFRRVVCLLGKEGCLDRCQLKDKCMYHNIFDAPTIHPFIIEPPLEERESYGSDDLLSFNLILIGQAIDYFPYFLFTFEELGCLGIGKGRGKYWLEEVFSIGLDSSGNAYMRSLQQPYPLEEAFSVGLNKEAQVYSQKDRRILNSGFRISGEEFIKYSTPDIEFNKGGSRTALTREVERQIVETQNFTSLRDSRTAPTLSEVKKAEVEFLTPTRLKYRGKLTSDLDFYLLFRAILMRLATLMNLYCEGGEVLLPSGYKTDAGSLLRYFYSYKELDSDSRKSIREAIKESKDISTERNDLFWMDWERYSNRQGERMKLGGVVGKISFIGSLGKFLPYLLLAEHIHVGKETTFGLGKVKVRT